MMRKSVPSPGNVYHEGQKSKELANCCTLNLPQPAEESPAPEVFTPRGTTPKYHSKIAPWWQRNKKLIQDSSGCVCMCPLLCGAVFHFILIIKQPSESGTKTR